VKGIIDALSPKPEPPQPPDGWDIANARDFAALRCPNETGSRYREVSGGGLQHPKGPVLRID